MDLDKIYIFINAFSCIKTQRLFMVLPKKDPLPMDIHIKLKTVSAFLTHDNTFMTLFRHGRSGFPLRILSNWVKKSNEKR